MVGQTYIKKFYRIYSRGNNLVNKLVVTIIFGLSVNIAGSVTANIILFVV